MRRRGRILAVLVQVLSLLAFVLLWQLASTRRWDFGVRFGFVPAPTEVLAGALELWRSPQLAEHIRLSLVRVYAGFGLAALLAVSLGLAVGRFKAAAWAFMPVLELLRPIPAVAWIPLAILMFPSPEQSMVYITFVGAFFPVLLATIHGVESVDQRYIHASQSLGAGPRAVFTEVLLPGALPSIVTGLSIGMGNSWFSLVTAEMISGQFGVGYYTWQAYILQDYPDIVVGMAAIGLLGMAKQSPGSLGGPTRHALADFRWGFALSPAALQAPVEAPARPDRTASAGGLGSIQLRGLGVCFGAGPREVQALEGVDIDIAPGEFLGVLGPSGCGKSTLVGVIAGFMKPAAGSVRVDGDEVLGPGQERGVVFQHHTLFPGRPC